MKAEGGRREVQVLGRSGEQVVSTKAMGMEQSQRTQERVDSQGSGSK